MTGQPAQKHSLPAPNWLTRFRALEVRLGIAIAACARFVAGRVPLMLVSLVYLLIVVAAPAQLTHILANFSTEASWLQRASFMLATDPCQRGASGFAGPVPSPRLA